MEYEINLEALVKMKRVFEEADADGSGELDIEEFTEKLGPYLGKHLNQSQIKQLFLKIDADCGGTIDWDEFTNYFFLQRGVKNALEDQQYRLFPKRTWRKEWKDQLHKGGVLNLYKCQSLDKYITAGKDGYLRTWDVKDLAQAQTVRNGTAWVTDVKYLQGNKKLIVASMDRSISFYNVVRHSFEYSGRLTATGQSGSPSCLAVLDEVSDDGLPNIFFGDTMGTVAQLKCKAPLQRTSRQLLQKDISILHQAHTDWVTQLLHIYDVGLLSSSLDSTVKISDLASGTVLNTFTLHRKPVRSLAYSRAFSLVASAGPERNVYLWSPKGNINHAVGELSGHSAGVVQAVMADAQTQVITLSEDNVVRLWDLRNHACIQTIFRSDWDQVEDSRPEAMLYDDEQGRLLTAHHRPALWEHRATSSIKGHTGKLCSALYNSAFDVVVSGDQAGNILMWNAQNGSCEGGFLFNQGNSQKLTAISFDTNLRRLLTASETGELKIWNFNSGAILKEYQHKEGQKEITAVAFLTRQQAAVSETADGEQESMKMIDDQDCGTEDDEDAASFVLASGWSRSLCIWEDRDGRVISDYKRLRGHDADVLCMDILSNRWVATGDFEGSITLWDLEAETCVSNILYGGEQWERAVIKLIFVPASGGRHCPLLVASGQDGRIKVWELHVESDDHRNADSGGQDTASRVQYQFIGEHPASLNGQSYITAMAVNASHNNLYTGSKSGEVRVLDTCSRSILGTSPTKVPFQQICAWKARQHAIVSIHHMLQHNLLLLGSDDSSVSIWTLQGGLVGIFGQHQWSLLDQSTWQDPSGVTCLQLLSEHSPSLTPREIIARTPRRSNWEAPMSPRTSEHVSLGGAGAAMVAATRLPRISRAAAHVTMQTSSHTPNKEDTCLSQQVHADHQGLGNVTQVQSPAAAGHTLAEHPIDSRVARDVLQLPTSFQPHGSLELHGLEEVPSNTSQIWGSITGYHGQGPQRSMASTNASFQCSKKDRCHEVQAILQKTGPAFGRSEHSQH